jgi:type IV secretory pathway VirJ component
MSEVAAPVAPVAEPAPAVTEAAATETTAEETTTAEVPKADKKSLLAKLKAIIKKFSSKKDKPAPAPAVVAEPAEPAPPAVAATSATA